MFSGVENDPFYQVSKMPYSWAAVVGQFLGKTNDYRYGAHCAEKAMLLRDSLPRGSADLLWDLDNKHFGMIVDGSYFDPTFYQFPLTPIALRGEMTRFYGTLVNELNIRVDEIAGCRYVRVGSMEPLYALTSIPIDEKDALNIVIDTFGKSILRNPPFIRYPNNAGIETTVYLDPKKTQLVVHGNHYTDQARVSPDAELEEMEKTYGFNRAELLTYFVDLWREVIRSVDTDL